MNGSVQTDPVTGRPLAQTLREAEQKAKDAEKARLRETAAWAGVTKSEAGAKLVGLVSQKLEKRVEELVQGDPEASAYLKILQELGAREGIARAAIRTIEERYIKEE